MTVPDPLQYSGTLPRVSAAALHMVERDKYSGGQATVHEVRWGAVTYLFKQYDEASAAAPDHLDRVHLLAGPDPQQAGLAVPLALVEESGDVVGYLMVPAPDRYLDGEEPRYLSMLGSDDPGYTTGQRLAVLGALLDRILHLHDAGVVIGDLKSRNIFIIDPEHLSAPGGSDPVFLVDCDSFAFTAGTRATQPYTDHMLPPQWHGRPLTRQTDLYQFALLTERALTGDFSLPPDQEPLHNDLRDHMDEWHWRVLSQWKSLDPQSAGGATRGDAAALATAWRLRWADPDVPGTAPSVRGVPPRTPAGRPTPAGGPVSAARPGTPASADDAPPAARRRRAWLAALAGLAITGALTAFAVQQEADTGGSATSPDSATSPELVWWSDLEAGDCIDEPALGSDEQVGDVPVVDCSEQHNGEVVGAPLLPPSAEYPGDTTVADRAWEACLIRFEQYTGQAYGNSPYELTTYTPGEAGWEEYGDRTAICIGLEVDGKGQIQSRTGSIRS